MPLAEVLADLAPTLPAHAFAFVLGAVFGSFGNVCIYRMPPSDEHPEGMSIASPPSRCGACGTPIRWYDNLPILSYLRLRGRCRACGTGYSPRYLLVEVATGLLFVAVYHLAVVVPAYPAPIALRMGRFGIYALFAFAMVVVALIDLDTKLILDKITYPAIPTFYLLSLALPERSWSDGLIGAAVGYGVVRIIADGYYLLTRREGMGYGDGKLLAMIGALFGWQGVVVSLFGGSLIGSVLGIAVLAWARRLAPEQAAAGRGPERGESDEHGDPVGEPGGPATPAAAADPALRHQELPFGPFLVAGAITYMFSESWVKVTLSSLWGAGGM
jgi:leader peptidase (prepilin peptidase)/N-methyltransferase